MTPAPTTIGRPDHHTADRHTPAAHTVADEDAQLMRGVARRAASVLALLDVRAAWPHAELVRVAAPMAADALALCAERVQRGEFTDLALLDGNYLRRSDAEIFGEPGVARPTGR